MSRVNDQIAALANMSPAELRAEWQRVYRTAAPRVGKELLIRGVAHRLQEKAFGGLDAATLRQLHLANGSSPTPAPRQAMRPGTKLIRSWRDRTISVLVTEDGFVWEEQTYGSLSQIAKAVTGTSWSGPKFFGLTGSARHG
jgi:hypothetical protein